jgi:hypothetical protein
MPTVLEEIGPRLRVRQIIIYTAIIFYRRFYQTYAASKHVQMGMRRMLSLTLMLLVCAFFYACSQSEFCELRSALGGRDRVFPGVQGRREPIVAGHGRVGASPLHDKYVLLLVNVRNLSKWAMGLR